MWLCYYAKAWAKSRRISFIFSRPIERRIVFGFMPEADNSSVVICEWVVLAGWITRDFASATLASKENNWSLSIKSWASFAVPLISNVKIEPPSLGKYFWYKLWSKREVIEGWLTFSTLSWFCKNSMTLSVFCTWRSTRKDKVSNPCKSKKALNGEIHLKALNF